METLGKEGKKQEICSSSIEVTTNEIMTYLELAYLIKEARKARKLTQAELAELADVSERTVYSIENSKPISDKLLEKILIVLGYKLIKKYEVEKVK